MTNTEQPVAQEQWIIERRDFQQLLDALQARGYQVIGPTVRDGAIVYAELHAVTELPIGWTDEQEAGHYRLRRRTDCRCNRRTDGAYAGDDRTPRITLSQSGASPLGRSGQSLSDLWELHDGLSDLFLHHG